MIYDLFLSSVWAKRASATLLKSWSLKTSSKSADQKWISEKCSRTQPFHLWSAKFSTKINNWRWCITKLKIITDWLSSHDSQAGLPLKRKESLPSRQSGFESHSVTKIGAVNKIDQNFFCDIMEIMFTKFQKLKKFNIDYII